MPRKKIQPDQVAPPAPVLPAPPSPAVLKLQEQVVSLVEQRSAARERLAQEHSVYLTAQAQFQAAEAALKGVEQDIQYRIGLIAQLENRTPQINITQSPAVLQMPSMGSISSEPAPQSPRQTYAMADAGELRQELSRGMI
jgi:hypothetical protein